MSQDWLLMEEEFVANQERLKPQEERNQADRDKACPDRIRVVSRGDSGCIISIVSMWL